MENTSYVNKARLVRIEKQNHVDRDYRFSQDSFIEEVDFDYMDFHLIEED